jgi:ketosteroid isomerase-like protein
MKKLIQLTISTMIACFIFSACQPTLSDANSDSIEKELIEFTYDIFDRFNNRDTATVYTFYSDDFSMLSRGENRIPSRDVWEEMKASAKENIVTRDETVYEVLDPWVEVYTSNVANVCYKYTSTTTFENGVTNTRSSACTWTMVKENGNWKIKHAAISSGKDYFRAVEGDEVWVLSNKVAADKKDIFEEFMFDILIQQSQELGGIFAQSLNQFRILRPTTINEDGTYSYIFLMDPVTKGANYNIMHYLTQMYDKEEAAEKMKMFSESLVEPQSRLIVEQTRQ